MVVIDSSAWIEFFNNSAHDVVKKVDHALANDFVVIGDLIYCEVLQGVRSERQRKIISNLFDSLTKSNLGGFAIAAKAANNYRTLRSQGFTIRKTIDCIIATYCLDNDYALVHADRDFNAFEQHLGLKVL